MSTASLATPASPGVLRRGLTALVGAARAAPRWTARVVGSGWKLGAQLGGGATALTGLHMLAGTAVTLVVAGLSALAVGTLAEMGEDRKAGR